MQMVIFHCHFLLQSIVGEQKKLTLTQMTQTNMVGTTHHVSSKFRWPCIQRTPGCRGQLSSPWMGLNLSGNFDSKQQLHGNCIIPLMDKIESKSDKPLGMAKNAVDCRESLDLYHINWFRILSIKSIIDITTLEFNCEF